MQRLRIRNPSWARSPQLARAERVEVQLDLGALLHGRIEIARLLVRKAKVNLETGPRGENNWSFGAGGRGAGALQIEAVQLLDSTFALETAQGVTHRLGITRLDLRGLGSEKLALEAALAYRDSPLSVSATSGQDGAAHGARWPFSIRAKTADATVEATGDLNAPFDVGGIEAELDVKGWRQIPATVKLDLSGADPRSPGGPRGLEVTVTFGDTALSGSLRLVPGGSRPKVTGDLSFTKIDLAGIAKDVDASKGSEPQQGAQNDHGAHFTPDKAGPRNHDRLPHPGPLPEGEGDAGVPPCS